MASSGAGSSKNKDDGSPFDPSFWSWNRGGNHAVVDTKGGDNKDAPPSPPSQGRGDAAATGSDDATPFPYSSNPRSIMRITSRKQMTSEPQTTVGRIEKVSKLSAGATPGHGADHHEPRRRSIGKHSSQNKKGDDILKKMVEPTPRVGEQSQQEKGLDHHPVPTNPELRSKHIHDRPQKLRLVADSKQKRPARFKKPELNVQVALTRQEIEEDLLAMTGMKPSRRPQKRPKEVQKLLDVLFPGTGLNGITEDKYRVNESSSRKG